MRAVPVLICLLLFLGCASTGIGSKTWYDGRIQEIESAYQNKEITSAEYFKLKNQADQVYKEYELYERMRKARALQAIGNMGTAATQPWTNAYQSNQSKSPRPITSSYDGSVVGYVYDYGNNAPKPITSTDDGGIVGYVH